MTMQILQKIYLKYNYVFDDLSDNSTKNWLLISKPEPLLIIIAVYLYISVYAGPAFMKNREPFKLELILKIYNVIQVLYSLFLTVFGVAYMVTVEPKFRWLVDYSDSPGSVLGATIVWWYFIAKISELLDTIFFVLRKKHSQLTFLHVYHHSVMPIVSWLAIKYSPGGQCIMDLTMNSFIHIIMYGYYYVAGLGPKYQKYLWWKKYLTSIQLVQFCLIVYCNVIGLFSDSNYLKFLNVIQIFNCAAFFYMFGKFYLKSYTKKNIKDNSINKSN